MNPYAIMDSMEISSRTPEAFPTRCPLCGAQTNLEFSDPGEDAPCPACGTLLLRSTALLDRMRQIVAETLGVDLEKVPPDFRFAGELGADSLDTVELVLGFEEEFDINIPDDEAEKIRTLQDLVRYLLRSGQSGRDKFD